MKLPFVARCERSPLLLSLLIATGIFTGGEARGAIYSYYIGTDNLATIPSGTYAGLANPNYQRLTFLLAHHYPEVAPVGNPDATLNHFHTVGSYQLTGPISHPSTTFINPRLPEGTNPALTLLPGVGAFAGKFVSTLLSDSALAHYSDIQISPLSQLRAYYENGTPNEPEDYMYGGYNNPNPAYVTTGLNQRYSTTNIIGTDVHFELVSLTAGLHIASGTNMDIMSLPGDEWHLGDGNGFALFQPKFWTDAGTAPGIYSATFKLTDQTGTFGDSGEFRFEFAVVPEPSAALLAVGFIVAGGLRRRRTSITGNVIER